MTMEEELDITGSSYAMLMITATNKLGDVHVRQVILIYSWCSVFFYFSTKDIELLSLTESIIDNR